MYNGIGLRTARGSGTNGYVQKNLSYVKPAHIREKERQAQLKYALMEEPQKKHPINKQILLHEEKRQIEVKLMQLRDELEEQGCDEDEIEEKCAQLRKKLQEQRMKPQEDTKHASSHARAIRKEKELAALKDAFGIRDTYVEGTSFDFELQEQKRIEEQEARDRKRRNDRERELARLGPPPSEKEAKKKLDVLLFATYLPVVEKTPVPLLDAHFPDHPDDPLFAATLDRSDGPTRETFVEVCLHADAALHLVAANVSAEVQVLVVDVAQAFSADVVRALFVVAVQVHCVAEVQVLAVVAAQALDAMPV
ncbi:unnamed protein product [Aphanomyces euteiches]